MGVAPGTRFGPYEIVARIGVGGMGEVFRARDPRLGRDVAIKVLRTDAGDPDDDRLRRFSLEARAASALNHPNILAVFDIGTHEGAPYVVSELLEGQSLRERLSTGPLPVKKATAAAIDIARGLIAAHAKGIVHRDLKPENIFVTRDGRVKILDFGIAKLVEPRGPGGVAIASTVNQGLADTAATGEGVMVGTPGYMAPEQVRGQGTDHRTDLFAFGALLHEMVTGRRAFAGATVGDLTSAILRDDPPDASSLVTSVPPGLESLIRHCLEKDPDERYQSARDLVFHLQAIDAAATGTSKVTSEPIPAKRHRTRTVALMAGAAILLVALGAGAARLLAGADPELVPEPVASARPMIASPSYRSFTAQRGTIQQARFSPDGHTIVFAASWQNEPLQIYSSRIELPSVQATHLPSGDVLALDPGGQIAIALDRGISFESRGVLAVAPSLTAGAPRALIKDVISADFAPDGKHLAIIRKTEAGYVLEFPVGEPIYTGKFLTDARVSPHGDAIAFLDHPIDGNDSGTAVIADSHGKVLQRTRAFTAVRGLAWAPDASSLWFSAGEGAPNLSIHAMAASDGALRIVQRGPGALRIQDISDHRVLVIHEQVEQTIVALPPGETTERNLIWQGSSQLTALTPDGATIAFVEQSEGAVDPVGIPYLRGTDGSEPLRLGDGWPAAVSSDRKFAYLVSHDHENRLVSTGIDVPAVLVTIPDETLVNGTFTSDNRFVVATRAKDSTSRWYLRTGAGYEPLGPARPLRPVFGPSPDLQRCVGQDEKGAYFVCPLSGGNTAACSPLAVRTDEDLISWTSDSRGIHVAALGGLVVRIDRIDVMSGKRAHVRDIRIADPSGVLGITTLQVAGDGKSYAYGYMRVLSRLFLVEGLQ